MNVFKKILRCFDSKIVETPAPSPVVKEPIKITDSALASIGVFGEKINAFTFPTALPGVLPAGHTGMANDAALSTAYNALSMNSVFNEGIMAFSYAYLSELTQRAEYRRPTEIIAKEMTRKWLRLQSTGDEDKTDKIKKIEAEMTRLKAQEVFRKAAELDGYFGRAHIYMDLGYDVDEDQELKLPITLSPAKIKQGSLKSLRIVEPIWTYPNDYNSTNPLNPTFYKPQSWFVMGKQIHASRLLTIVGRPMPDILKPAYQFGGLSLSQMLKPYVDNWLQTRQAVSDLIHSFSISVLKLNMGQTINTEGMENLRRRIQMFVAHRDNRGLMVVDKDTEELDNISTPLTSLPDLQAQSQEHMSSVTGIPLSILFGITPTGLNADNDGEIRTFFQWVEDQQVCSFSDQVEYLLKVVQLSLFGAIDDQITFVWEPLWSLDEKELAEVEKIEAETDAILLQEGVISPEEVRTRLSAKEDSAYHGLKPEEVPEPPIDPAEEKLLDDESDGNNKDKKAA